MATQSKQMTSALILIADGTEETEFVSTYDVLVRAGISTRSVGVNLANTYAECSRGVKITPDVHDLAAIPTSQIDRTDILILPGGAPGAATFCGSETVMRLIREFRHAGKHVAFICAATTALVKSTGSEDSTEPKCIVTSHPSVKQQIVDAGWEYADDRDVVVAGNVITSRGPGTALLFALTIVEEVLGRAKRDEVQGPLMLAH